MRRFFWCLLYSIGLTACRIEPTPERFIDQQAEAETDVSAAEAEIRDRLSALPEALQAGSSSEVLEVLSPDPGGMILLPGAESPVPAERVIALLEGPTAVKPLAMQDAVIEVDSAGNVAWFLARYAPVQRGLTGDSIGSGLDFSGVFNRRAGAWRLVQGHLSSPITSSPAPALLAPPQ